MYPHNHSPPSFLGKEGGNTISELGAAPEVKALLQIRLCERFLFPKMDNFPAVSCLNALESKFAL